MVEDLKSARGNNSLCVHSTARYHSTATGREELKRMVEDFKGRRGNNFLCVQSTA